MTEVATVTDTTPDGRSKARRLASTLFGPLWVTTFRDPVRTGRLRLDGLSFVERHAARAGLVTMVLLLGSMLFTEVWRRGDLLPLTFLDDPRFVPDGLVPVTLVAFFLALTLVVWGALDASPSVRLAVAGMYLATVSVLGVPTAFDIGDRWMLAHGPMLVRVGYWVPFGALVLSAVLSLVPGRVSRWSWPTAVLRAVSLLGFGAMLVGHLGMQLAFSEEGFTSSLQSLIHSGFTSINGFLLPLGFVTAAAVVDFATDVSTSVAEPARGTLGRRSVRLLSLAVVAVILAKLWYAVWHHRDYWSTVVVHQPGAVLRTLVVLAIVGVAAAYVVRTVPPGSDSDVDETKERLTLGGAVVLPLAAVLGVLATGFAQLVVTVFKDDWGLSVANAYPVDAMSDIVPITASVLALVTGVALLRRGHRPTGRSSVERSRELGSGLLILGAWNLPAWIDSAADLSLGFSYPTIDVALTLGVLGWLLVRWRRLDAAEATMLLAVVLFSWLVTSRGDYLSFLGGLLGLPGVVVVVFGVLYTLLSGSGFTTESSRRLPRESRTLMYVGYLLLSVTILHWLEVIHEPTSAAFALSAYYFLALPLAIWLLVRRVIPRQLATR